MGLNLSNIYNAPKDIYDVGLTESVKGSVFNMNDVDEMILDYRNAVKECTYDLSLIAMQEGFNLKDVFGKVVAFITNILNLISKFIKNAVKIISNLIGNFVKLLRETLSKNKDIIKDTAKPESVTYLGELEKRLNEKNVSVKMCDIDNIANLTELHAGPTVLPTATNIITYNLISMEEFTEAIGTALTASFNRGDRNLDAYGNEVFTNAENFCKTVDAELANAAEKCIVELFGDYHTKDIINHLNSNESNRMVKFVDDFNKDMFGPKVSKDEKLTVDLYLKCKEIIKGATAIEMVITSLESVNVQYKGVGDKIDLMMSKLNRFWTTMTQQNFPEDQRIHIMMTRITNTFRQLTNMMMDIITTHQKMVLYKADRLREVYSNTGSCMNVINKCREVMKGYRGPIEEKVNFSGKSVDALMENRHNEVFNQTIDKLFNLAEAEYSEKRFNFLFEQLLLEDGEENQNNNNANNTSNANSGNNATNNASGNKKKTIFEIIKGFFKNVADIFRKLFKGENSPVERALHGDPKDVAAGKDKTEVFKKLEPVVKYNDEVGKVTLTDSYIYDLDKIDNFEKKLDNLNVNKIFPTNTNELFSSEYLGQFSADINTAIKEDGAENKIVAKYLRDLGINVENDNEKLNITQLLHDSLSEKRIGKDPEKLTKETFEITVDNISRTMDETSRLRDYEKTVVDALERVANANFDNFDANNLDAGTITTLKQIFGDDSDNTGEAKQESVSYETYNVLRSLMEAIQTNGAGSGNGESGGNNSSGNMKLVNKYLNGLKSMAKAKIKIIQAYINFKCAACTACYGIFITVAEAVYTDDYNRAVGGNGNNKPADNNPADANQQNQNNNNNQQQNNNNQNNGNK
nr:MAG TPA: hypothetical protein [Caudoviricetes sp.]